MKRRLITSIFLALVVTVTSSVVLTGCASKSYYYKQENGAWTVMGEIPDTNEGFDAGTSSTSSTEESKEEESKEEESKEEESKEEESKEEESKEEESKEEESKETPADSDSLATVKFEKPDDWADDVTVRVFDSESNTATIEGTADGSTYVFVIPKKGDQGNEFVSPKIMFMCTLDGKVVETGEAELNGDKTYTAGDKISKGKFALVEK